jgi:hypothetical protein
MSHEIFALSREYGPTAEPTHFANLFEDTIKEKGGGNDFYRIGHMTLYALNERLT